MLIRHAFAGLPSMRSRIGIGLRQPGLTEFAREVLTWMKGLTPRMFMTELKRVVMEISSPLSLDSSITAQVPTATALALNNMNGGNNSQTIPQQFFDAEASLAQAQSDYEWLQAQIAALVYELYDLTDEEIAATVAELKKYEEQSTIDNSLEQEYPWRLTPHPLEYPGNFSL